ncbi:MAG: phosphatase PAP2 family protein [Erysipelotrichaceae bacterium]|nr:phosphatase PAP2 family protein [Erysipelotrichaceae bacterium]
MGVTFQFEWEIALISFFQNILITYPILADGVTFLTMFGEAILSIILIGIFYWGCNKEYGKRLLLHVACSSLITFYVKNIVKRRRPYFDNEEVVCFRPADQSYDAMDIQAQGYSFPSGHATLASSTGVSLAREFNKTPLTVFCITMIILVAFSRFILGVHYPTDVIVGTAIGTLCVFGIDYLLSKYEKKKLYLIFALVTSTGIFFCNSLDFYTMYGMLMGFLVADLYEEKYVNFKECHKPLKILLRCAVGALIFVGTAEIIKFIAPSSIADGAEKVALLFRSMRYFVGTFLAFGLYPNLFKYNIFN